MTLIAEEVARDSVSHSGCRAADAPGIARKTVTTSVNAATIPCAVAPTVRDHCAAGEHPVRHPAGRHRHARDTCRQGSHPRSS